MPMTDRGDSGHQREPVQQQQAFSTCGRVSKPLSVLDTRNGKNIAVSVRSLPIPGLVRGRARGSLTMPEIDWAYALSIATT